MAKFLTWHTMKMFDQLTCSYLQKNFVKQEEEVFNSARKYFKLEDKYLPIAN